MAPIIEFLYTPAINFAMQQNHVPVVRKLAIQNNSENDWQNLLVTITAEPDFTAVWKQSIDIIKAGETYEFSAIHLPVAANYLAELTEKISGSITLKIDTSREIIFEERYPIEVLAYDQWNGVNTLPEMLAAFVTPNHPQLPAILRSASSILQTWTGNPSFDEYQTRSPDRVRKQMAAIYEAISELQLIYCAAPASFEQSGQRIRLADAILTHKLANCLDLSLLYAACLEAVQIRPIIVIIQGHAFAGAWLTEESFADAVNDDPSLLTKRMAEGINEIAIIEATCMNAGNKASFTEATSAAAKHLYNVKNFNVLIDVKRARYGGIRPLPLRIATAHGWEIIEEQTKTRNIDAPDELAQTMPVSFSEKAKAGKQQLWERKLLDLTLRNTLLNLRVTKSTLQFIGINPAKLEDALAGGTEFQVLPKPLDWDNPIRNAGLYQAIHATDPIADLVNHELTQKRLRTYLSEGELALSMTNVYRNSRLAIEENGASTLYIALGFLKWYETAASERPLYAPILLAPVEIVRKPAPGYVIRSREEETMMNITLLEKLRQDYGITINGLEILPRDESGVDVKAIFNILRHGVMGQARWDVDEQSLLGTFSFNKFILWNDIHNNADKLIENKIVSSLISGRLQWKPEEEKNQPNLDAGIKPADLALPISADSSQLEAILSAADGKSFVLHGPPGTGKSQTITNIIANALYAGKKVLFVAAKKAALDVVETRLDAIGLAPFCLELHSNKAKKTAVLQQLRSATEVVKKAPPQGYASESERLFTLRNELNDYVQALHQKQPFGFTLFDAFSNYSRLPPGIDMVKFSNDSIAVLTENKLTRWNDLADEMATAGGLIIHPHNHPLQGIAVHQYTSQLKEQAKVLLQKNKELLQELAELVAAVLPILKIEKRITSREQVAMLITLAEALLRLPDTPAGMLGTDALEQSLTHIKEIAAHGKKRDEIRKKLAAHFNDTIVALDAAPVLAAWNRAATKWFLPKWWQQRKIVQLLNSYSNSIINKQAVPEHLQDIINYKTEQSIINQAASLPNTTGFLWRDGACDWDNLIIICNELIIINRVAATITGPAGAKQWRYSIAAEFAEGSKLYLNAYAEMLQQFADVHRSTEKVAQELQQLLGVNENEMMEENWPQQRIVQLTQWLQHIEELKDWTAWTAVKEKAIAEGLHELVTAYENGSIATAELVLQYQKGLYRSAADFIISGSPQLAAFNGVLFEEKIRKFKSLSKNFEQLTRDELYARLAANIPAFTQESSQRSEIGILQKNLRNNGRATSIRRLFDSIPNLLPRLTPCMLMSPISVAQYFDAGTVKFDLVIFDEASQLPTCEAVSAIARGTNVIVVGDPNQMPPTNFFSTNNVDEENIEQEDLESILDDCLALSIPSKYLLWHYRSRHESLIAFSNAKYYDNKLLTFPSTDDITTKVTSIFVPGYYDKGKTRQNHFEAKAIVAEVIRRLQHPELIKRSMGIVTFSVVQQNLIEDLLNEEFRTKPQAEKAALESEEPIFIKNLENVQGDERDVILFSIGYGPDEAGKISLNFGPVNREGGWRRLNVAASRARYEMQVFATLRSDQIDITRTSSEGVAGLKAFLAYAEKGKIALPASTIQYADTLAGFEYTIAEVIRQRGYEVHTGIGCSAYKIDMGIVNPQNKAEYLLGILCDGKSYNAARTSRDREIVQPEVLTALGWHIHKIWSVEWWEKPEQVMKGIIAAIEKAIANKAVSNKLKAETVHSEEAAIIQLPESLPETPVLNKLFLPDSTLINPANHSNQLVYEVCMVKKVNNATVDDFLQPMNHAIITRQIMNVLNTESPISKTLLCKRVLTAWNTNRISNRIMANFDRLISEMGIRQTIGGATIFLWKAAHNPAEYSTYRIPANDDNKREPDDLPPEEIANAIKEILKQQISLPKNDLSREVARVFGFARIGNNVENVMNTGIEKAFEKRFIKEVNSRIVYAAG